jgi:hypothetical protein
MRRARSKTRKAAKRRARAPARLQPEHFSLLAALRPTIRSGDNLRDIVAGEVQAAFAWYFDEPLKDIPEDTKLSGMLPQAMYAIIDRVAMRLQLPADIDRAIQNRYRAGKIGSIKDLIDSFTSLAAEALQP